MPKFRVGVAIEGGVTMHIDAKDEDEARVKVMELCDLGADVAIDGVYTDTVHREYFVTDVEGA